MDLLPTMEKVLDRVGTVIDAVEPSQLDNATLCTEWTVRDAINHVVGGATMFAECVEQGSVPDDRLGQLMGGDNLGDDYKGAYHAASYCGGVVLHSAARGPWRRWSSCPSARCRLESH